MDWNLKATSWDLSGLEQEAVRNVGAFDKSTGLGDPRSGRDFSIDLKLGRVGNLSDQAINMAKQPGVPKMESLSSSGSTKRARAGNNGTQVVSCLVDGCNSDLSNCRDYHRRHKVCELHSKTPQVTVRGHKRRFCQQCSRFHALEEFDEGKRSCRKRLDGHNRRRRKPQPDSLSRPASYLSGYRVANSGTDTAECSFNDFSGSQMLQFSGSHVYPSTTVVNPTWSRVVSTGADSRHGNLEQQVQLPAKQSLLLGSSLSIYKGEKQFPFFQADTSTTLCNQIPSEASVCQPLLRTVALSESSRGSSGSSSSMFCDRLTTQVRSADCALSLLSSTQTQPSGNNVVQAINPSLEDHGLEPIDAVLVSNGRDADEHCPGMFHVSSGASSGNKAPQTLPFAWE